MLDMKKMTFSKENGVLIGHDIEFIEKAVIPNFNHSIPALLFYDPLVDGVASLEARICS